MTIAAQRTSPLDDPAQNWEKLSVFHECFLHTTSPSMAAWMRSLGYCLYLSALEAGATTNGNLEDSVEALAGELRDLAAMLRQLEGELPARFAAEKEGTSSALETSAATLLAGLKRTGPQAEGVASRLSVRRTFTAGIADRMRNGVPGALSLLDALLAGCSPATGSAAELGLATAVGFTLDLRYAAWFLDDLGRQYHASTLRAREDTEASLLAESVAPAVWATVKRLEATLPESALQLPEVHLLGNMPSSPELAGARHHQAAS